MRIFVAGASGVIGVQLTRNLLAAEHERLVLDAPPGIVVVAEETEG